MLIAFALLLGLGMALLVLPVLISLRVEQPGPGGTLRLRLSWGFFLGGAGLQLRLQGEAWQLRPCFFGLGLPFPRLGLGGGSPAPPPVAAVPEPAPDLPPEPGPEPAGRPEATRRPGLGEIGELVRPAIRLLRRLAGTLRWRRLHLQGSFGLANPADTGQLFGYLQAVRGVLPQRLRLELCPDFVQPGVRGRAHLAVHFHLGKALYLVVSFAARLAWRRWGRRRAAGNRPPNPTSPRR